MLITIVIAVLSLYFKAFYTTGVYFDDTFLKKRVVSSENHYIGKSIYGRIQIIVKELSNKQNSVEVIYYLPNNINRQYTVSFKNTNEWEQDIENIKDKGGNIIFHGGKFRKDVPFLFDAYGQPFIQGIQDKIPVQIYGENPYNANYNVPLYSVVSFATFAKDTIRGKYSILAVSILIFVLTLIDIKYPLFFFKLRNSLDVKNPEPSDFYITMQRLSWYVSPIIAIVLMIVAIY